MEYYMTCALLAALTLFVFYLIAAGSGVVWLKVTLAIITVIVAALCLLFLYASKELLKPRSLWMSVSALAILVCLIFSLVLNFPSPEPPKFESPSETLSTEST